MSDYQTRELTTLSGVVRTGGTYDLSIGTSLAIEGLMGVHPDKPANDADVHTVQAMWINVRTLIRNTYEALGEQKTYTGYRDLADIVYSEMVYIEAILKEANPKLKLSFYYNKQDTLLKKFKPISFRVVATPKAKAAESTLDSAFKHLLYLCDKNIYVADIATNELKEQSGVVILSHYILDLLFIIGMPSAYLLESHTGVMKKKTAWATKLGEKEAATLPFCLFTIRVFGDKSNVLMPLPVKYRRAILELAKKNRWSMITTVDKMRMNIKTINDPDIRDLLLSNLV